MLAVASALALAAGAVWLAAGRLWLRALLSGACVPFGELLGMRLRGLKPAPVVDALVAVVRAGVDVSRAELEAHALAGGRLAPTVAATIAAAKGKVELDFSLAAALDLAGRDPREVVAEVVIPPVVDCPPGGLDARSRDGVVFHLRARLTARGVPRRALAGEPLAVLVERTTAALGEQIADSESWRIRTQPHAISGAVLARAGLDAGCAHELLSLELTSVVPEP